MMPTMKSVLRTMTTNILKFAALGNPIGGPFFILNTAAYLQKTEDETVETFVTATTTDKDLNAVCTPYQADLKRSVGNDYGSFSEEIACTVSTSTIKDFSKGDFSKGWGPWMDMTTRTENMPLAIMAKTKNELDDRIESKVNAVTMEANQGSGFMSWKECSTSTASIDMDRRYDGCTTVTPGSIIANKVMWADTSSLREMEIAGDFNNISFVLADRTQRYSNLGTLSKQDGGLYGTGNLNLLDPSNPNYISDSYQNYSNFINGMTGYDEWNPPPVPYTDGTNDSNRTIDPISRSLYNADGTPNTNLIKNIILAQIKVENDYYNAQNVIASMFSRIIPVFASSTACSDSVSGIVNQMRGVPSYDQTDSANLSWNQQNAIGASLRALSNRTGLNDLVTALSVQGITPPQVIGILTRLSTIKPLATKELVIAFTPENGPLYKTMLEWIKAKGITCGLN